MAPAPNWRTTSKCKPLTSEYNRLDVVLGLHAYLDTVETPFNKLSEKELCPGAGVLEKINAVLR